MKKLLLFLPIITLSAISYVTASSIVIESPDKALSNRQPIVVQVFLDQENNTLSGVSGNFSFPADLFSIESISVENSIVSLWVKQPSVSLEKYLDNRTHITFEGIFPGGYNGVRSPYYSGVKPGRIFYITLVPKNKGNGIFIVDNIEFHAFDQEASRLPSASIFKTIIVPDLLGDAPSISTAERGVYSKTLEAFITRDPLINNNAWYLVVNDREQKSAISDISVAEDDTYNGELVPDLTWKHASTPYVLFYQNRSKYVHVKVLYADHTYSLVTLLPVENSESIVITSRILVSVVVLLSLLYFYVHYLYLVPKEKE